MEDPAPENITGHQERRHTFNHNIDWHYVALAVAVIVVAMKVSDAFGEDRNEEQPAEIDVEGRGQAGLPVVE